jgi:hypothetical protein
VTDPAWSRQPSSTEKRFSRKTGNLRTQEFFLGYEVSTVEHKLEFLAVADGKQLK